MLAVGWDHVLPLLHCYSHYYHSHNSYPTTTTTDTAAHVVLVIPTPSEDGGANSTTMHTTIYYSILQKLSLLYYRAILLYLYYYILSDAEQARYNTLKLIHEDNQSTIKQIYGQMNHNVTKHISPKFHYVKQQVELKKISVIYTESEENTADIFTKPLNNHIFRYLSDWLLGRNCNK